MECNQLAEVHARAGPTSGFPAMAMGNGKAVKFIGHCVRVSRLSVGNNQSITEGKLVVGATCVEGDGRSPVSVRRAIELLTSAYSVLPALAEARILEFNKQVRPALPDNLPALRFDHERKVPCINVLYRHGFLLTPTVVEEILALLSLQKPSAPVGRCPYLRESCTTTPFAPANDEVTICLSS